ncbi:MAG: hypothetical protein NTY34_00005, partial [Candidatus Omnitrophica bacterium]|nr:hypothetical protein [Candidatus Omnitrophota bacterium]
MKLKNLIHGYAYNLLKFFADRFFNSTINSKELAPAHMPPRVEGWDSIERRAYRRFDTDLSGT